MGNKLSPLVFIDENINKDMYIDMLKQNLLGFIDVLIEEGFQGIVFQQDNTYFHITKVTQKWLENVRREHEFIIMK